MVLRAALVGGLVSLMLAGCGGGGGTAAQRPTTSSHPATTATATTTATAYASGRDYLRLVAPFNAALARFTAAVKDDTDSTPTREIAHEATPLAAALTTFDNAVLRMSWPPGAKADVRALVRADAGFRSDLDQIAYTRDWAGLTRDAEASSAAANVVRADLGLPPPQ